MSEDGVDVGRRRFLATATSVVGGLGAAVAAVPFLAAWKPSARAQAAGAPVEVDISKLEPSQQMTVEWRGKPVWIIRRTEAMVNELPKNDPFLRDPNSEVEQQPAYAKNVSRAINPEYFVAIGICTHLGCVPTYRPDIGGVQAGWPGGFFCPCHGSKFDLAGRVYQGVPAPSNLVIPPYSYLSDSVLLIGEGGTA